MRRRDLIILPGGAAATPCEQQAGKVARIGFLVWSRHC